MPIIFVGEFLNVALIAGTEKVWIRGGGISTYSVEFFLSHSADNFRRGILYCCSIFGYRKSLDKKGGGVSRFFVKKFLSHSAEYFCREILYSCSIFGYRKSLDK